MLSHCKGLQPCKKYLNYSQLHVVGVGGVTKTWPLLLSWQQVFLVTKWPGFCWMKYCFLYNVWFSCVAMKLGIFCGGPIKPTSACPFAAELGDFRVRHLEQLWCAEMFKKESYLNLLPFLWQQTSCVPVEKILLIWQDTMMFLLKQSKSLYNRWYHNVISVYMYNFLNILNMYTKQIRQTFQYW